MPVQRYLDKKESAIAAQMEGQGLGLDNTLIAIEYQGLLDVGSLQLAFEHLATRNPVFRAKIRKDDTDRFLLYVPDDHNANLRIIDNEIFPISRLRLENIENRKNGILADECARLIILRGNFKGYVVLGMTHLLIDAASVSAYWSELWQIYADIVDGKEVTSVPGRLPEPPSSTLSSAVLVSTNNSQGSSDPNDGSTVAHHTKIPETPQFPPAHYRHIHFSDHETAKLSQFRRTEGVGVAALLAGAMLELLRKPYPKDGLTPLKLVTVLDARRNTKTRIGAQGTAWVADQRVTTINVDSQEDFLAVARKVNNYHDKARNERPPSEAPIMDDCGYYPDYVDCDVFVNNGGIIGPNITTLKELKLVDFGGVDAFVAKTDPSIASYIIGYKTKIVTYTFNERMTVRCWIRGDLDASMLDAFESRLRACM